MTTKSIALKIVLSILFTGILGMMNTYAQQEVVLGEHIKKGKGNSDVGVVTGEGIGLKLKAGRKSIKLTKLNMQLLEDHPDSVTFYIRLFPFENGVLGENRMPDKIYTESLKGGEMNVDLSDLDISVSGDFVIGLEWAAPAAGPKTKISLPTGLGLFKKGVYYKKKDETKWKKVPFFGLDIVVYGVKVELGKS